MMMARMAFAILLLGSSFAAPVGNKDTDVTAIEPDTLPIDKPGDAVMMATPLHPAARTRCEERVRARR